MEKVLVTGGCGFIGSNLCKNLIKKGYLVTVLDNLQTGSLENIAEIDHNPNFTFIKGDVNREDEAYPVIVKGKFDYVFHYSACVGVQRTLTKPFEVFSDIEGLKNVLNASVSSGVKQFFYSSSSEVYGEPVIIPQNENSTPLNARLPYAVVKNLGEVMIKAYHKEFGLPYTIFRFFNTYGKNQSKNFVISKFMDAAINNRDITIYGDGTQTRSFINIDDNVFATTNAMRNAKAINKTINIGSDRETTINTLARTIIKVARSESKVVHLPPLPEGDMTRRLPDNTLMKTVLGLRHLIPLEEGLQTLIPSEVIYK